MSAEKIKSGTRMIAALCRMRDKQREEKSRFRDRLDFILGIYEGVGLKPSVNELILAIQAGDVTAVIDLIDTNSDPISPNKKNQVIIIVSIIVCKFC